MEVNGESGIGWLTLALINAGLAQGKNRSGLNWFFISLLIGPLATLLIVVWDRIPKEPERKKMY
ncbi:MULTISPECIES: antitermination protein NusB [Paenibacillus]|uniref:antitermination protein NusB n=1 Tax=Paenibacillus TaxID=44249 RepID=UPI001C2F5E51|nr:antitermination protein NusB [Paenibacillus sp. GbtcB18]